MTVVAAAAAVAAAPVVPAVAAVDDLAQKMKAMFPEARNLAAALPPLPLHRPNPKKNTVVYQDAQSSYLAPITCSES